MREKCIALENGVYISLIWRQIIYIFSHKHHIALVSRLKAADNSQSGGFTAAGGTQKSEKFVIVNIQIYIIQNNLTVKGLAYTLKLYNLFHCRPYPQNIKK